MLEMQSRGYSVVAIAPEDIYSCQFIKHKIDFIPITLNRKGYNPIRDLSLAVQLYKIYKRLRPTFIHHFTIKPVIFGSIAARMANSSNIINSITGLGYTFLQGWIVRRVAVWVYKISLNSKYVKNIFQNPDDLEVFTSNGIGQKDNSFLILSSGVDLFKFANCKIEPNKIVHFLFLSRMLFDKGLEELKQAKELLKSEDLSFKLILAGSIDNGNPRSVSEEWLKVSFNDEWSTWIGYRENVEILLGEIDVVILPSFYREGLPHCLTEALAAHKPIITTDVAGCREVYHNNGVLIPPRNAIALYRAMKKVIESKSLSFWGENSRKLATKFDVKIVNKKTISVYNLEP